MPCADALRGRAGEVDEGKKEGARAALGKAYGTEEACAIVRRAVRDRFVLQSNCTLRSIVSKADSYRGAVPIKTNGRHIVQPGAPNGGKSEWELRAEARELAGRVQ